MDNLQFWNKVAKPPVDALKQIKGGRLKGMTDIKPQWRYKVLTEEFGMCGVGWKYEVVEVTTLDGSDNQIMVSVKINLYVKVDGEWSDPIPGIGGSMFIAKESKGLFTSDECIKMATTDALSTACKMLGVGADIYAGKWDGSKYKDEPKPTPVPVTKEQLEVLEEKIADIEDIDIEKFLSYLKVSSLTKLTSESYKKAIVALDAKAKKVAK